MGILLPQKGYSTSRTMIQNLVRSQPKSHDASSTTDGPYYEFKTFTL